MNTTHQPVPVLERIIVGSDFSEQAAEALKLAAALTHLGTSTVETHVVHVVSSLDFVGGTETMLHGGVQAMIDGAREQLGVACAELEKATSGPVIPHVASGDVVTELVAMARTLEADLVIVGARSVHRWERPWHRSTIAQLARRAPCSVLAARSRELDADAVVEPPCEECLATRRASAGKFQWCSRHGEHHVHAHVHHVSPDGAASSPWTFRS